MINGGVDGVYKVFSCENGRPLYKRENSPANGMRRGGGGEAVMKHGVAPTAWLNRTRGNDAVSDDAGHSAARCTRCLFCSTCSGFPAGWPAFTASRLAIDLNRCSRPAPNRHRKTQRTVCCGTRPRSATGISTTAPPSTRCASRRLCIRTAPVELAPAQRSAGRVAASPRTGAPCHPNNHNACSAEQNWRLHGNACFRRTS